MIYQGDCLIKLKELPENSVDSVVTDPPAGISFMGKKWDEDKGGRDHWIKWMCEVATECKRVLKPGGHAFVWAIPRTSHWTATAWENAGFEIRDVVAHIFGSGFPKSLSVGKAVDKLQGNEREVLGTKDLKRGSSIADQTTDKSITGWNKPDYPSIIDITKGTSPFEGWGTALKPAREDWLLMRKPLSEKTVAENCLRWGTGGINIDESRVGTEDNLAGGSGRVGGFAGKTEGGELSDYRVEGNTQGRFPANLIHDNSEEVRECFPETKSGKHSEKEKDRKAQGMFAGGIATDENWYGDSGSASRFFKSIIYTAKASKSERNKGCEGLEDKFRAGLAGADRDTDEPLDDVSERFRTQPAKNNHPTVKPVALMEYLIKMVTPKGGTVLDPFMGSGSTGVAAKQNGYGFIGIEMEAEYIKIAEARINAAQTELF